MLSPWEEIKAQREARTPRVTHPKRLLQLHSSVAHLLPRCETCSNISSWQTVPSAFNGRFQHELLCTYQGPSSMLRTLLPQLSQSAKLACCRLAFKFPFQVQKLKTQRG